MKFKIILSISMKDSVMIFLFNPFPKDLLKYRKPRHRPSSVQISSVAQSCLTLGDPMNCSMPGPRV